MFSELQCSELNQLHADTLYIFNIHADRSQSRRAQETSAKGRNLLLSSALNLAWKGV